MFRSRCEVECGSHGNKDEKITTNFGPLSAILPIEGHLGLIDSRAAFRPGYCVSPQERAVVENDLSAVTVEISTLRSQQESLTRDVEELLATSQALIEAQREDLLQRLKQEQNIIQKMTLRLREEREGIASAFNGPAGDMKSTDLSVFRTEIEALEQCIVAAKEEAERLRSEFGVRREEEG